MAGIKKYKADINHPIYQIFKSLKKRISNKKAKNYIGEGYSLEWKSFDDFYDWAIKIWQPKMVLSIIDKSSKIIGPQQVKFNYKSEISRQVGLNSKGKLLGRKKSKEVIEKTKQTNLERYGFTTPLKSEEVKQKIKETCLEKYGVSNPAKLDEIKNITKENNLKKYGVEYPQQLLENRLKAKQKTIDNGQANIFHGKTSDILSEELQISRSGLNARIRKYGFERAISMEKHQTDIENIIQFHLNSLNLNFKHDSVLGNFRPDFLLEEQKIIIECDGLYWHSDAINSNDKYHKNKLDFYENLGYRAFFFREDEINKKYHIVTSIINNALGNSNRIFARKCKLSEIKIEDSVKFFNDNHLMGKGSGKTFGLKLDDKLVCAIRIINKTDYLDISRFCTLLNTSVVGGYSRLLKHVEKLYKKPISTFIDRRYGSGKYLINLGFEKINEDLSFSWTKNDKTYHRLTFKGNSGYDYGYYKIWDCGQARYTKKPV